MSGGAFQNFKTHTAPMATVCCDATWDTVIGLVRDVHLLRYLLTVTKHNCDWSAICGEEKNTLMAAAHERNTGFFSQRAKIETFDVVRDRVELAMKQLHCMLLDSSEGITRDEEGYTHLFAVLRLWADCSAPHSGNDVPCGDCLALMEKLGGVTDHLEALVEKMEESRRPLFAGEPVAFGTRGDTEDEEKSCVSGFSCKDDDSDGAGRMSCVKGLICRVNYFLRRRMAVTTPIRTLRGIAVLYGMTVLLTLGLLFLDYNALSDVQVSLSSRPNSIQTTFLSQNWSAVQFCVCVLQLMLVLAMGIVLFTAQPTRSSVFTNAAVLKRATGRWDAPVGVTTRRKQSVGVDQAFHNDNDDYYYYHHHHHQQQRSDNSADTDGVITLPHDTVAVKVHVQPTTPIYHFDEENKEAQCKNNTVNSVTEAQSCKEHIPEMCLYPCLMTTSDESMESQFNLTDTMSTEEEMKQKERDNSREEEVDTDNEVVGPIYPQCIQAGQEILTLITDVPSGVAEKCNDFSSVHHADRTAKICRHLTDHLQDSVCPLVILECVHTNIQTRGNYKSTKGTGAGTDTYPVSYCNFPALELLSYRWSTEVVGKDFRSFFGLYRCARNSSLKKRTMASRVSALPALVPSRERKSQSRPVMVPSPPPKAQGAQGKRRRLEEISDPRSLFENGVEERLTLFAMQKASSFDVYAMSIDEIVLPSSFCDISEPNTPHSSVKSYVVLLFLRQVTNEDELDGIPPKNMNRVVCKESLGRVNQSHSPPRVNGEGSLQRRASSARTGVFNVLGFHESVENEEGNASFFLRGPASNQPRRSTTAGPQTHRRRRRSTVRGVSSPVSAERGHAVDRVTAQQLREQLDSKKTILKLEMSARVPEDFLINFVALMIFINRVLKRYKCASCSVDAENMYLVIDIKTIECLGNLKGTDRPSDGYTSASSREIVTSDTTIRASGVSDASSLSFLSAQLMDYLRACEASITAAHDGCTLRFPYTTQERLALMENLGSLQLSTVRGLSLMGLTATNAMTEGLAGTDGQMIHLDQYASAEKAFSEAMSKANALTSPIKTEEMCPTSPTILKGTLRPDVSCTMSFFAGPVAQPMEETAATSLADHLCGLPTVIGGARSKGWDPELNIGALSTTQEFKMDFDPNPMHTDLPSTSYAHRMDNIFGRPDVRGGIDAMATSITSTALPGVNSAGHRKRYLHVFLYMRVYREDVVEYLWARGHSVTVVCETAVMKRYLLIGMHLFDAVFIEWTEKLVTPDIRDLIAADAGKQSTLLYLLNEDAYTLPLPPGTPNEAVLRMHDMAEIFTNPSIGQSVSLYIQQRQLRHEMVQIRWLKNYQIVRRLGGGAFGDVYEVYLFVSRGRLAMKRLFLAGASNRVLEQLNREVLIMSQMDHPNIVSFSHSSMEDHAYCIFMELCDETLSQRLQQTSVSSQSHRHIQQQGPVEQTPLARLSAGAAFSVSPVEKASQERSSTLNNTSKTLEPLTPREVVLLLHDIASGIAYIHSQGVVHRDIKPCNILFCNGVAKIGDFGIAAEENADRPLINMKGTLAYMSPEVLLGEPYGKPCDIWSYGCLVAETIGLRLGHLHGLHVPALIELYRAIPPTESLPITVANYKGGKLQHHYGESTTQMILSTMKSAFSDACGQRQEASVSSPHEGPTLRRERILCSSRDEMDETQFQNSMCCDVKRSVTCFSTRGTTSLDVDKVRLPESLVELLENLFHRNPQKRMTAEDLLRHPVTWDVEWMDMVIRAVEDVYSVDTDDQSPDASPGAESTPGGVSSLDLSIIST